MKGSSVTDWIQAVAVVIGVAFAIYELRISNRSIERVQKEATYAHYISLIEGDELDDLTYLGLSVGFVGLDLEEMNAHMQVIEKADRVLHGAAFCHDNDICHSELSQEMFCPMVTSLLEIRDAVVDHYDGDWILANGKTLDETRLFNICAGG
ncbi:hypothetical protein [Jannaschia sp. LMIT008]|uniref:hypothetical protein n=1 Tax=Jannaschia maritima TaxID=3032585 RepID=UPI00281142C2|nr:hypothetical protein [Jannaschia sp. LMIT008]